MVLHIDYLFRDKAILKRRELYPVKKGFHYFRLSIGTAIPSLVTHVLYPAVTSITFSIAISALTHACPVLITFPDHEQNTIIIFVDIPGNSSQSTNWRITFFHPLHKLIHDSYFLFL